MPCYEQVTISVALALNDRRILEEAVKAIGATLTGNRVNKGAFVFTVSENGQVSTQVNASEQVTAKQFLGELKRAYTIETLKRWSKANGLTVRQTGERLIARRWS